MERQGITSLLLDQKWNAVKVDDIKTEGLATASTLLHTEKYLAYSQSGSAPNLPYEPEVRNTED